MAEKVALITGGARGIGKAVALDLAKQGWSVAICFRTSATEAAQVIDGVKQRGARGAAFQCDVSDPDAAAALVERVNKEWGRIDAHGGASVSRSVPQLANHVAISVWSRRSACQLGRAHV